MKWIGVCPVGALVVCAACARGRTHDREPSASADGTSIVTRGQHRDPNDQDRSGVATLTSTSWVTDESAIDRIVASRCAREVECRSVGPERHFATSDVCRHEMRQRMYDELKSDTCPNGIDALALEACLETIRNESCTNAVETIGRLVTCRARRLCSRVEVPHR